MVIYNGGRRAASVGGSGNTWRYSFPWFVTEIRVRRRRAGKLGWFGLPVWPRGAESTARLVLVPVLVFGGGGALVRADQLVLETLVGGGKLHQVVCSDRPDLLLGWCGASLFSLSVIMERTDGCDNR